MPHHGPPADPHGAFAHLRDGVCVVTSDWRLRYANASFLEILRLAPDAPTPAVLWTLFPGWEEGAEGETLRQAMALGQPARLRSAEPEGRVWEVDAAPLPRGEMRIRLRNVTAAARLEEMERRVRETALSLEEREARLDAVLAGAPVGIVLIDAASLTVVEANDAAHGMLEGHWRQPGSTVGHRFADFVPGLDEAEVAEVLRRVRDTGQPFETAEYGHAGFARGPAWFRWSLHPVAPGGGAAPRFLLLVIVDVTPQVRGRRRSEASAASLYALLDSLAVGVAVVDGETGRTTYASAAAAAAAEATTGAGDGGAWRAFRPTGEPLPPEDFPAARVLRGETAAEMEVLLRGPGGAERVVLASGVAVREGDGPVAQAALSFVDVTERQRLESELVRRSRELEGAAAEAALRAEEARALREIGRALASELEPDVVLRLAARNSMELLGARGACVTMSAGEVLRVAPAFGTLASLDGRAFPYAGTTAETASRERRAVVIPSPDAIPAGSAVGVEARRLGVRNLLFAPLQAFEEPLGVLVAVDREGGFGPEEVRLMEALADAAALAVHNAALFARERRRAEENRALLAAAEALTSTLDPAEVMARIVGIAAELVAADGAGLTLLREDGGLSFPVAVGCLAPFRDTGASRRDALTERVLAAGGPVLLDGDALEDAPEAALLFARLGLTQYALVPLRADGDAFGVLGVVNRRTSRRFTADDLRLLELLGDQAALAVRNARAHEAAQAAARAKGRFLAVMSHELRTPLNALAGYASLMGDGIYGPVTDAQRGALEKMGAARTHLLALIDQVLELARVDARQTGVEPAEVDVAALAREVGEELRPEAAAKSLTLVVTADDRLPLRTDARLLRQVLTSLVGNAVKFTEAGGVELRVEDAAGGVRVEVEDTGPGIATELAERIFEPFFQADASPTRPKGGTGLGLAIAREFTRLLGGELTVHSEPGRGTVFSLVVPAAAGDAAVAAASTEPESETGPGTADDAPAAAPPSAASARGGAGAPT